MRRIAFGWLVGSAVLAAACSDTIDRRGGFGSVSDTLSGDLDVASHFETDPEDPAFVRHPRVEHQVYVAHIGEFARRPGEWQEPPATGPVWGTETPATYDALPTDPPRIINCDGHICTALYLRGRDLRRVPTQRTELRPTPRGPSRVEIDSGVRVEFPDGIPADNADVRVAFRENDDPWSVGIRATGMIPRSRLGYVFQTPSIESTTGEPYNLREAPVPLFDRPGGAQTATLAAVGVEPISPTDRPWVEVRARSSEFATRGYVRRRDIQRPDPDAKHAEVVGCPLDDHYVRHPQYEEDDRYIPGGTWLHLEPEGARFGYVRSMTEMFVCGHRSPEGWRKVWVDSHWGPVRAWISPRADLHCARQTRSAGALLTMWRNSFAENMRAQR